MARRGYDETSEQDDTRSRKSGRYPSDISAESSVLGACLEGGLGFYNTLERMSGDGGVESLFFDRETKLVARALERSALVSDEVSFTTVSAAIEDLQDDENPYFDNVNGYLVGLVSSSGISQHDELITAVKRLVDLRSKRIQLDGVEVILQDIMKNDRTPFEISDDLRRLSNLAVSNSTVRTAKEVLDNIEDTEIAPWRSPTGIAALDKLLRGGYEPGGLHIIAARPKVGKTTFLINAGIKAAIDKGYVTLFASLEMNEREVMSKMLSSLSFVEHEHIAKIMNKDDMRLSDLPAEQRKEFKLAREDLEDSLLHMVFSNEIRNGVDDLIQMMLALRSKYDEDTPIIVFIDYLQLLIADKFNSRAEMDNITRRLKLAALDLNIAIVAPSQINRSGAEGGMPSPHQMRDSGGIEQDANTAMILHRPYLDDESEDPNIIEFWLALSRSGPSGKGRARWLPEYSLIQDLEEDDDSEYKVVSRDEVKRKVEEKFDDDEMDF